MESMCDTLYLMRTLNDYEAEREGYEVNPSIEDSIRALEMTTDSNCQKSGSRTVRMIAIELNRLPEYDKLYKFLSKMSHPTPWSMIGNTNRIDGHGIGVKWDQYVKFLLKLAVEYSGQSCILLFQSKPEETP